MTNAAKMKNKNINKQIFKYEKVKTPNSNLTSIWFKIRPFLIGMFSTQMASMVMQPIDMLKTYQHFLGEGTGLGVIRNPFTAFRLFVTQFGVLGLYRGLTAQLWRQTFYGTTRLGVFRTLTDYVKNNSNGLYIENGDIPIYKRSYCALIAACCASITGMPPDCILVRMQSDLASKDGIRGYRNVFDAFKNILKNEGILGFYIGYTGFFCRCITINFGAMISFDPCYQFLKYNLFNNNDNYIQLNRIISGLFSAWCAATLSLPADMIKCRLQKQKADFYTGKLRYYGAYHCFKTIAKQEGFRAFYQSYRSYCLLIIPHNGLAWFFLENFNDLFKRFNL